MLISVVICTHNRANYLTTALDSICKQTLPISDFEIIIVDNNSNDSTKEIIENFKTQHSNIRYLFENKTGLSYARNRGWQYAEGIYIAYTDDDAKLPSEWLATAAEIIKDYNPDIFGGPYYAYYDTPKPAWFKDDYGSGILFEHPKTLHPYEVLVGNNLFIRRGLITKTSGFKENLGMKGTTIGYGEETELQRRLHDMKAVVYYDPRLYIYHLVRKERMSLIWLLRQRFAQGRYSYLTFWDEIDRTKIIHILGLLVLPMIALIDAGFGVWLRPRSKYPYWQNYYYEQVFEWVAKWGKLIERFRQILLRPREKC